jgi:hypothetical protein
VFIRPDIKPHSDPYELSPKHQYFLKIHFNITLEPTSLVSENATKPNPFEIVLLQTTRKENIWKTEEALERAVVTLETERIEGSNP